MRLLMTLLFATLPMGALAHVGHLGELAGHDHTVAGVAVGVAIGVAIWGALAGRKGDKKSEEQADSEAEPDAQEPQEA